ncbi:MAG: thiopurine S-methyltransferase [Rhodanobacter sp.]|nr:MAG: thiopurine S-methyltransferase [Rhodanobacter sp.]TAM11068.1 MAG: thiopurine S-methyltransferase [Rhodanobacter sp.]TAM35533.1 MAG: thiopurine S-methyltransferase [Rhodanobacter sp.]
MQADFWLQCWREGHIGFHLKEPLPLLIKHWPDLDLPADSRVFVPLCGKSPDMAWLVAHGYRVLGVELSPIAVEQFFDEHGLAPERHATPFGTRYTTDRIDIIQGDVFGLDAATLASCTGVYDRAAVVALPADLRQRYAHEVYGKLPAGCRGLMVTLEYPQREMDGPPFSVEEGDVEALLGHAWDTSVLDRRDILASEPKFRARGLSAFHTAVYRLSRRAVSP